jgi:hypothetical protein
MTSASEYTGEPSAWYDQGSASDMTARLPFCACNGDTTVNGVARAVHGDDEPGPFGPDRLGGIMSDTPLAGRVAMVSGGGRGLGRSFCRALARQGARVVVNNRNRVTDAGLGGMFHKQPAARFGEVLEINLQGSVRRADQHPAAVRPHPADRRRHARSSRTGRVSAPVSCTPCWPRAPAAREAHGAVHGGGVRRVRSAHQRLHPLAAALRGWHGTPFRCQFQTGGSSPSGTRKTRIPPSCSTENALSRSVAVRIPTRLRFSRALGRPRSCPRRPRTNRAW